MELNVFDFVFLVDKDNSEKVQCKLCSSTFNIPKMYNIKRHYASIHNKEFNPLRKRQSTGDKFPIAVKRSRPQVPELFNTFLDAHDYIGTCVRNHTECGLPFIYWDTKSTRRIHKA